MKKKNISNWGKIAGLLTLPLLVFGALAFITTTSVYADDCTETSVLTGIPCDNEGGGIWALLNLVLMTMTAGVAILGVGGIAAAAFIYITAEGSSERVQKAKTMIFNVVIGLILYAAMFSLLNFFIPGGLFS